MINLGQMRKLAKHVNADHARKFTQHMVPHVVRPAQIIWNQIIGFIFLAFALGALSQAYKFYRLLGTDSKTSGQLVISLVFGVLMLSFGIGSFWRARKLSRK